MSAPFPIKTPLSFGDARELVEEVLTQPLSDEERVFHAWDRRVVRIARLVMAVDVASREQAVPDYDRLKKLVESTEEATRGTQDVQQRLALVEELAVVLGRMVILVNGSSAIAEAPYQEAVALLAKVHR